jgi:hypothetical protein
MRGKYPLAKVFQQDILKALYVARHGVPKIKKEYILNPSGADAIAYLERYRAAGFPLLSWDIETPYSKGMKDEKDDGLITEKFIEDDPSYKVILRISFSHEPFKAITMPWVRPYTDIIKQLLESGGDKLVWNKHFDVPRVRAHGINVQGRIYDGMDAFHFYEPSFPMGLKYAATFFCPDMHAWKLDSRDQPEWYNAADSDVALRCFLGTREALIEEGRWKTFERHFVDLSGVLGRMSARGVLVDRAAREDRRREFEEKLEATISSLQPLVPVEVRPKHVFKSSEERLRKGGKWIENGMVKVTVLEPWKEPKVKKEKPLKQPRKARGTKSQTAGELSGVQMALQKVEGLVGSSIEGKPPRKKRTKSVRKGVEESPKASTP